MSKSEETEVVKWYTRARRFPQLIGKTHNGTPIWGGPYTYTQVFAGVGILVLGTKTTWLWGGFGLIGNALVLLGVAYGVVLLVGRMPIGSRNPLSIAAGAMKAWISPSMGRYGGHPVKARRVARTSRAVLAITHQPTPVPRPGRDPSAEPVLDELETTPPGPATALTGVQKLLATTIHERS